MDATEDAQQSAAGPADAGVDAGSGHIGGVAVPTMVDGWPVYPSVRERYYTTYTTGNHQCVHVHSNGLCVLGVSPSHPSLQPPLRATAVHFRSHDGKNLLNTSVSGKKKSGAVFLSERDMVCTVDISDGSMLTLYACVRGSVIEINERLQREPHLLGDAPQADGFLCVMLPKLQEKGAIGRACEEFDHSVLIKPSGNEKRRQEGKQVRSKGAKRQKGGEGAADGPQRVCWDWQRRGACKWGERCRFRHGEGAAAVAAGLEQAAPDAAPPPQAGEAVPAAVVPAAVVPAAVVPAAVVPAAVVPAAVVPAAVVPVAVPAAAPAAVVPAAQEAAQEAAAAVGPADVKEEPQPGV